ncbi:MAG: virulence protein RhuM/Fic/DOC family protein, partial [Microgenomates group bacterium]
IWLSQIQIAKLFQSTKQNISLHLKNIFLSGELAQKSVVKDFLTTAKDGKKYLVAHYNLDAIISVGYRVNSRKATQFRIWATKILKDHLLRGYTINKERLLAQRSKFKELQTTIDYLENQAKNDLLRSQGLELLSLVRDYTRSLNLLEQYDNKKFTKRRGAKVIKPLTVDLAQKVIENIRDQLSKSGKSLGMLGIDTNNKLESIIRNLNQTFGGTDLYPNLEGKAANLLYLTIKDHPFLDGNKRIGSMLFIIFLDQNNYLYRESGERKINDNALVALALLVAVSPSSEKELIIDLIKSLVA